MVLYGLVYIHTDDNECSEHLGIVKHQNDAVLTLIKTAHYENRNGELHQYRLPSDDYNSFDYLVEFVHQHNYIYDYDIYYIYNHLDQ